MTLLDTTVLIGTDKLDPNVYKSGAEYRGREGSAGRRVQLLHGAEAEAACADAAARRCEPEALAAARPK